MIYKILILHLILFFTIHAHSQEWKDWNPSDTTWHVGLAEKDVDNPDSAEFWGITYINPDDTLERFVEQRYKNGSLRGEKWTKGFDTETETTRKNIYYAASTKNDTGQINHSYRQINRRFRDTLRSWWPDGALMRLEIHGDEGLISGSSFDPNGIEELYTPYFEYAVFRGGDRGLMHFLGKNIEYPKKLRREKVSGMVWVSFDVAEDGSVENWEITQSSHELFSAEVIRVMKIMPKWKPGRLEGEKVKVEYNLPVQFNLR